MDFQWNYAKPLFAQMDIPDYGSRDNWMRWYEESWTHLTKAGLTQVGTPLDSLIVRLRIFAVGWLAHDFVGAVQSDKWSSCPYWSEWISDFEINPLWALLTLDDRKILRDLTSDSGLSSSDSIEEVKDEGLLYDEEEINGDFFPRIVMAAVYVRRAEVIDALMEGFGGVEPLFMSMYANCYSMEEESEERINDLEEELEQFEWQLEQATSDEMKSRLQTSIDALRQKIEDGMHPQDIIKELRLRAGGDDIYYGDEESGERLNGFLWCYEGCPVVIRGEPEFYLP